MQRDAMSSMPGRATHRGRRSLLALAAGWAAAGLTAGALASRSGLRVALFEQHTRPGGCAGDFAMDGFTFPAGATVVTIGGSRSGEVARVEPFPPLPPSRLRIGTTSTPNIAAVRALTAA